MELREIKGFEDYLVSDSGVNDKTVWSKKSNKWIKPHKTPNGYVDVCLCKDGIPHYLSLHRIIAEAYIPNPENRPQIDHISTIKTDNRIENLRWVTRSDNMRNPLTMERLIGRTHTVEAKAKMSEARKGRFCGKDNPKSIPIVQLTKDGEFVKQWYSTCEVGRELGICHSHISSCCKGKLKTTGGFRWMYLSDYMKMLGENP